MTWLLLLLALAHLGWVELAVEASGYFSRGCPRWGQWTDCTDRYIHRFCASDKSIHERIECTSCGEWGAWSPCEEGEQERRLGGCSFISETKPCAEDPEARGEEARRDLEQYRRRPREQPEEDGSTEMIHDMIHQRLHPDSMERQELEKIKKMNEGMVASAVLHHVDSDDKSIDHSAFNVEREPAASDENATHGLSEELKKFNLDPEDVQLDKADLKEHAENVLSEQDGREHSGEEVVQDIITRDDLSNDFINDLIEVDEDETVAAAEPEQTKASKTNAIKGGLKGKTAEQSAAKPTAISGVELRKEDRQDEAIDQQRERQPETVDKQNERSAQTVDKQNERSTETADQHMDRPAETAHPHKLIQNPKEPKVRQHIHERSEPLTDPKPKPKPKKEKVGGEHLEADESGGVAKVHGVHEDDTESPAQSSEKPQAKTKGNKKRTVQTLAADNLNEQPRSEEGPKDHGNEGAGPGNKSKQRYYIAGGVGISAVVCVGCGYLLTKKKKPEEIESEAKEENYEILYNEDVGKSKNTKMLYEEEFWGFE